MKKTFLLLMLCLLAVPAFVAAQTRIVEFSNPRLHVFLPPAGTANGKAVVACPGGGYSHLATAHEGYNWAPFFNNLGFAYAVLEYRMPNGDRTIPTGDVDAAFKIMTDSAAVWNFDPGQIGIMGSSAGGHLASTMSTHQTENCRPAFQILFYPVISLENEITHQGTRKGFLGENPSEELVNSFSAFNQVNESTPKAFITLSSDDKAVPPMNSLKYYAAMQKAGIPVTMAIYPTGGHGWGYRTSFKYHDMMLAELTRWLKDL